MSGAGTGPERTNVDVRRGEVFELVLPNFATAGFQWQPTFDNSGFTLVGIERRGDLRQVVFRFRALGSTGKIALALARPGRAPQETRTYTICVSEP
ncbi:hypothetical protein V1279_006612 [Bradyrhizobium sp. AZCC 1610]